MSQPHVDSAVLEPRSTSEPKRVLGISGSLRRGSYNRLLLRAAAQVAPTTVEFVAWDGLKAVPPFDEDDEAAPPPPVVSLREAIAGVDVTRTPPHKRNVGVVFQNYALFPHLSVAGNVGFGLKGRASQGTRSRRRSPGRSISCRWRLSGIVP